MEQVLTEYKKQTSYEPPEAGAIRRAPARQSLDGTLGAREDAAEMKKSNIEIRDQAETFDERTMRR